MRKTLATLLLAGTTFLTGCGDSENFVFTNNNNNPAQQLPVAVNDAYNANEDTQLVVNAASGVLANDRLAGGTITEFDASSTGGGTVVLDANGSFTYTPSNSFTGLDTFTYTLTNSIGSDTATVTITVVTVNGFFVDATNGDDGTGSFQGGSPFATIQAAVATAPAGADIVVRPGNYTGAVNLKDNQRLLGSGSTLVNAQGIARPELTGPVNLADGNIVDFVRIEGTNGDAIFGVNSNGATITNCEIADLMNLGVGVRDDNATGTWTIESNSITNVAGIGITLTGGTGNSLIAMINNNVITGNELGALAFSYAGTGTVRAQVTGNTMTGTVIPGRTFEVEAADNAELCFDIVGNTNDDAYSFVARDSSTIEVEELDDLLTINTGSAVLDNPSVMGQNPAVQVPDNHCMFNN